MELFHEVRNSYFFHTVLLISLLQIEEKMTKQQFYDSFRAIFKNKEDGILIPDYVDDILNNVFFYDKKEDVITLQSEIGTTAIPVRLLSCEKEWLLTVLKDSRSTLLLNDKLKKNLSSLLRGTTDTISTAVEIRGLYNEADDVTNPAYINNFRTIVDAIQKNRIIYYCNTGAPDTKKQFDAVPFAIEYSILEGKFRVSLYSLKENRPVKVNFARMYNLTVGDTSPFLREEISNAIQEKRVKEPLTLNIKDESKNQIIERCFALFSTYDREGQYEEKDDSYILRVFYYTFDETEIIRKILMLGPDVEIIGNAKIKELYFMRLIKQMKLLQK